MDNKVIEVLDYMGEKLGIAIDWTAENVMPQVTEFMERYQVYAIIEHGIYIIMFMILIAIIGVFLKRMFKGVATKDHANIWYDISWSTDGFIPIMIAIVCVVVAAFTVAEIVDHIFDIAKWALIPEMQFFETFSNYLKSAG